MATVKVRLVRSPIDRVAKQRGTVRALGLRRIGDVAVHEDRPEIRGMIRVVRHLVDVEESEK